MSAKQDEESVAVTEDFSIQQEVLANKLADFEEEMIQSRSYEFIDETMRKVMELKQENADYKDHAARIENELVLSGEPRPLT